MALIKMYFDVGSLHSWILFEQLCAVERCFGLITKFRPVRANSLFLQTGHRNPYYVLPLRKQLFKEVQELSKIYGVSFNVPQEAESKLSSIGTAAAQQFLAFVSCKHPERLKETARLTWRRLWIEQRYVHSRKDFSDILCENNLPVNPDVLSPSFEGENELQNAELEAVGCGCFDVPFVTVERADGVQKSFFGLDQWPLIAKQLNIPQQQRGFFSLRDFNYFFGLKQ